MPERIPPHNVEAEKAILGSILVDPKRMQDAAILLEVDWFFLPMHREIFDAMLAIHKRGRAVEVTILADELKARGMLVRLEGGEAYLITLANSHWSAAIPLSHHAKIVRDKAGLRAIIAMCENARCLAYENAELDGLLETIAGETTRLVTKDATQLSRLGELVDGVMADIDERMRNGEASLVTGVRTGIKRLDQKTSGWQPSDLVVVAADTGGGKTALASQCALLLCEDGGSAIVFNLEMPKRQIAERALVHASKINSQNVRTGQLKAEDFTHKLYGAHKKLAGFDLYVEDDAFSLRDIYARARLWRAKHPKQRGLVVVDFLQLVEETQARGESRAIVVGRVTKRLKRLAKELDVVVMAVSQFNRGPARSGEPPSKTDLKESGDIEQAADSILLIWNKDETEDGEVELRLDKHRNGGGRCKAQARWVGRYYRFTDPEEMTDDQPE